MISAASEKGDAHTNAGPWLRTPHGFRAPSQLHGGSLESQTKGINRPATRVCA